MNMKSPVTMVMMWWLRHKEGFVTSEDQIGVDDCLKMVENENYCITFDMKMIFRVGIWRSHPIQIKGNKKPKP